MRITSKGQVTIPQEIRERLGLLPNTEVEFAVKGGEAVIRRKKGAATRAQRVVAHLKAHGATMRMSSAELLALLRDEPDEIDPR
ncbi:MAG TPA: AbrB/MazE/SpoVT family DNA-binding domain-containing protein [Vicinamibacterales bacterium]|nr:AbrB/MazE/SpoVT family DNA-binding domain-containing protein [Vicinamibacterales bacterium]